MRRTALKSLMTIGRFAFVVLLLTGSFVFAMFQGGIVSWTIFYALLPFAVYSILLYFYPLSTFKVHRQMNASYFQTGELLKVTVTVTRKHPFPLPYLIIEDRWFTAHAKENNVTRRKMLLIGFKRQVEWTYEIEQVLRGEHVAPKLQLTVTDFFGWIQKNKSISLEQRLLVFPKVVPLQYMHLEADHTGGIVISPFNFLKDTNIVSSVRDYEAGDRMTWIHWKSFAKTQTLMTKEFEDRGSKDFHLLFDRRDAVTFEAQVSLVASILQAVWKERTAIQFTSAFDRDAHYSIQTDESFKNVFTYLAKVQPLIDKKGTTAYVSEKTTREKGVLAVVTGRLDAALQNVLHIHLSTGTSVFCFVVKDKESLISQRTEVEINEARMRGMIVKVINDNQLADVFKEVHLL